MFYVEKETSNKVIIKKTSRDSKTGLLICGDTNWKASIDKSKFLEEHKKVFNSNSINDYFIMGTIDQTIYYNSIGCGLLPSYIHIISKCFVTA